MWCYYCTRGIRSNYLGIGNHSYGMPILDLLPMLYIVGLRGRYISTIFCLSFNLSVVSVCMWIYVLICVSVRFLIVYLSVCISFSRSSLFFPYPCFYICFASLHFFPQPSFPTLLTLLDNNPTAGA